MPSYSRSPPGSFTMNVHRLWDEGTPISPLLVSDEDTITEPELVARFTLKRLRETMDKWIKKGYVTVEDFTQSGPGKVSSTIVAFRVGAQRWAYHSAEDLTEEMVAAIGLAVQFSHPDPPPLVDDDDTIPF